MIKEHPSCIVHTYLQWLQDSDFDPSCKLCRDPLNNGSEVVRLMCHDVFHGQCLNNYISSNFNSGTAPAGYTCPTCSSKSVVPPDIAASPVAVALRSFISRAPWAALHSHTHPVIEARSVHLENVEPTSPSDIAISIPASPLAAPSSTPSIHQAQHLAPSVTTTPASVVAPSAPRPRPPVVAEGVVSRKAPGAAPMMEEDEDKYARRPANAWFAQLVGNTTSRVPVRTADPNASLKRTAILLILLVIGVVTLIEVLTRARPNGENDQFLDPHMNPNVRTE